MRTIDCPFCHKKMEITYDRASLVSDCENCGRFWQIYPIFPDAEPVAYLPQPLSASDSSCYNHPENAAVTGCEACGRLVCNACHCSLFGKPFCAACWGMELPETAHLTAERLKPPNKKRGIMNTQKLARKYFQDRSFLSWNMGSGDTGLLFGQDHLVFMEAIAGEKDYSRIRYRDIRYLAVHQLKTKRVTLLGWVGAGLFVLLCFIPVLSLIGRDISEDPTLWIMFSFFVGLLCFLIGSIVYGFRLQMGLHYDYALVTDVQSIVFLPSSTHSEEWMIPRFRERISGVR